MSAKDISIEFENLPDVALKKLRRFVKCLKNENYSEIKEIGTWDDDEEFADEIDSSEVKLSDKSTPVKLELNNLSTFFEEEDLITFFESIGVEQFEAAGYNSSCGEFYFFNQDGYSDREIEYPEFEGEFVVVTGKVGSMSREEFEELIEDFGGTPQRSITSKTTLIFIGDKPGKSKLDKARELGIREMHIDDCRDDIKYWGDDW